jgi:hypothetical protein
VPPGSSGLFGKAGGGVVVVAEHPGGYRSWGLEDKVADCCAASPLGREAQLTEPEIHSFRGHGLSGPTSGESHQASGLVVVMVYGLCPR